MSQVATLPLRQVKDVRELLMNDQARGQLAKVAAKHMNPERMMRVVANAIRTTPQLAECDPMSMLGALMTCASLGLEPNTPLGHAYLIPFKNTRKNITEVQMIIGYKGFADLARRSGQVIGLHADVVYSDDELWSYEYGSDMHLRHKPGPRKGKKTHAYCHVTLKDGQAFVVLPWEQVLKTRDASQGWKTAVKFGKTAANPWGSHEDRMGAKTAVRALANAGEMPLSIEFLEAADTDERSMSFDPTSGVTVDSGAIEGEVIDPDTGEVTQLEQDVTSQMRTVSPKVEPEPAKAAVKATETKAPEQTPATTSEVQADLLKTVEVVAGGIFGAARDEIFNDLNDGAPVDGVLQFHAEKLEALKAGAPEIYAEVMAAIAEAQKAA